MFTLFVNVADVSVADVSVADVHVAEADVAEPMTAVFPSRGGVGGALLIACCTRLRLCSIMI